jgi:transposase
MANIKRLETYSFSEANLLINPSNLWLKIIRVLVPCMLTSVMVNNSLIGKSAIHPADKAGVGEASEASRAGTSQRREFGRARVFKAVTKREPRRPRGTSPNSRLNRRRPTRLASSHLQVREKTMSEPVYVGIDVAKETFHVATCPNVLKTQLPNTPQGYHRLSQSLQNHTIALIVLEATGGYERPLTAELLSDSLPVVVVNPRQVRDFAKGMGQWAKTDPIDAQVLAKFAQIVKPAPKTHSTPQTAELSELVRRRRQLNDLRTQESNRLLMIHHPKVKKSIQKMIKTLNFQIDEIDRLIREHIDSDSNFKNKDRILRSTPGVGPQTSAMLIANLPELGSLNRQEIAALAGLAPWDRSSGKSDGKAHIWGGRKEVRSVLYMAAFTACRFNPVIRALAERLKQKGKAYKVVITACMRKLLIILNTMVRNQTLWSPEKSVKNT